MKPRDLPVRKRLIQLAEEAAELSQASLKLIRAMDGDTPVSVCEATWHLLEEMADVYVTALTMEPDRAAIEAIARQKSKRWEERLSNMAAADAFFTKKKREAVRRKMEDGHDDEGE